jgi:hypothetical protein
MLEKTNIPPDKVSAKPANTTKLRIYALLWLLLGAALVFVHIRLWDYAFDDAYIHIRIADHLVTLGAPYFNPGEAIMASSSSGWTLFLAFIIRIIGVQLPVLAVINALFTWAGAFVFTRLAICLIPVGKAGFIVALFPLCYVGIILQASIGLMETPLTILILGIALSLLMSEGRYSQWGLVLVGALPFFRLEFSVFVALLTAWALIVRKIRLIPLIGYLACGALPFVLYDWVFFRTLIPNTIAAESIVYTVSNGQTFAMVLDILSSNVLPGIFRLVYLIAFAILIPYLVILSVLQIRVSLGSKEMLYFVCGLGGLFIAVTYVWQHTFIFPWYAPLMAVPLLLAACTATLHIRQVGAIVFLALAIPWLYTEGSAIYGAVTDRAPFIPFVENARVFQYISVGRELYAEYPNARLLTSEIGGLGYGFPGYILDGAGLASPEALKFHPLKIPEQRATGMIGAIPPDFVREVNPELIVGYDTFMRAFLNSDLVNQYIWIKRPRYVDAEMQIERIDPSGESNYLYIGIRKDLAASTAKDTPNP